MRQDERGAIARAVHQRDGDEVGGQLGREVQQDEATEPLIRDGVMDLKDNEQQWCQVVDNGLGDVPRIARPAGVVEGHRFLWEWRRDCTVPCERRYCSTGLFAFSSLPRMAHSR